MSIEINNFIPTFSLKKRKQNEKLEAKKRPFYFEIYGKSSGLFLEVKIVLQRIINHERITLVRAVIF